MPYGAAFSGPANNPNRSDYFKIGEKCGLEMGSTPPQGVRPDFCHGLLA
jgi:hypothetical protein